MLQAAKGWRQVWSWWKRWAGQRARALVPHCRASRSQWSWSNLSTIKVATSCFSLSRIKFSCMLFLRCDCFKRNSSIWYFIEASNLCITIIVVNILNFTRKQLSSLSISWIYCIFTILNVSFHHFTTFNIIILKECMISNYDRFFLSISYFVCNCCQVLGTLQLGRSTCTTRHTMKSLRVSWNVSVQCSNRISAMEKKLNNTLKQPSAAVSKLQKVNSLGVYLKLPVIEVMEAALVTVTKTPPAMTVPNPAPIQHPVITRVWRPDPELSVAEYSELHQK